MTTAIEVADLKKNYAGENALDGLSLSVPSGSLYALIGADGAGKTTLMRILATLLPQDQGTVRILSLNPSGESAQIRTRIGYMPQRFSLYEDLSVTENMLFFADVFGVTDHERDQRMKRLLQFSKLGPFANRRAGHLSGGMKQKLALSCALIHNPNLLLLDEPTTGVDPVSRKEFWLILQELKADGIAMLVSTPYMEEAEYADQIMLLHQGRALVCGTPQALKDAYPGNLYRISSSKGKLRHEQKGALPASVLLVYQVSGDLHVVSDLPAERKDEILRSTRVMAPKADSIEAIRPRLEDLFFYHLTFGSNIPPVGERNEP